MPSSQTTVDAVVFDMDGLILDSEPVYRAAAQRAAAGLGFELTDAMYLSMVGRNRRECERMIETFFGAGFPMQDFNAAWPGHWSAHIEQHGVQLKPGFVELLAHVVQRGLHFAIATSSDRERAEICLRSAGVFERFEVIVTGDTVERSKPAPDIYLRAASLLGVQPARCIAFEDSEPGALAGLAASMQVMLVPDLVPASADLRPRVTAVLDSLHDAPAAMAAL